MSDHAKTLRETEADTSLYLQSEQVDAILAGAAAIEELAALKDPATLHMRILRGDLTLTQEQKRHLAGQYHELEVAQAELAELRAALEWFVENGHVDHGGEGYYVFWINPASGEYDQGPVIDKDLTTALIGAYREAKK